MALTELQRTICRLLARHRISRDIDLFHDTNEALEATWHADRGLLAANGFTVQVLRERIGLVEAEVSNDRERVRIEWARDSSFRFFPLVEHDDFGLTLHPFDLATNKVLALVGRLEVRDWIDVITCHNRIQPLGYLAWAACGKDPGFSPASILEHAKRTGRYSVEEIGELAFAGQPPDAATLAREWHVMLDDADAIVAALPAESAGTCVLTSSAELCHAPARELPDLIQRSMLRFHAGRIRGALPILKV